MKKSNEMLTELKKVLIEAKDEYLETKEMWLKEGDAKWGKDYERCLNKKLDYEELYERVTGKEMRY